MLAKENILQSILIFQVMIFGLFNFIFLKVLNDQLTEKLKSITASKKPVFYRNFFITFWSSCIKQTIPRKIKQIVIYLKFRP
jgi:hypothetical protein